MNHLELVIYYKIKDYHHRVEEEDKDKAMMISLEDPVKMS